MKKIWFISLLVIISAGCNRDTVQFSIRDLPALSTATAVAGVADAVRETPNWVVSPQKKLLLSWTEQQGDSLFALRYTVWEDSDWAASQTIAQGKEWFVNWADFPSLAIFPGSELNLLAHYLKKRSGGTTYDYDIEMVLSNNGGQGFRSLGLLHDTTAAEHGFVSLLPFSYDKILAAWLDGGEMIKSAGLDDSHHDHGGGSMQLRSALVDVMGRVSNNTLLDDKICECCQTDAAMTGKGPVIVYRNRDDEEHRDIFYTRYISGQWTNPKPVFEDHWKISGCPVNGPSIATFNNQVAVAWYTEAGGKTLIKLSISKDAGESFATPVILSENTLGRVDVVWIDEARVAVSYLEKNQSTDFKTTFINLVVLDREGHILGDQSIAETSSKRKSGFPVLESLDNTLYLAYTRILDSVRTDLSIKEIKLK